MKYQAQARWCVSTFIQSMMYLFQEQSYAVHS
jgi:hypothetical protein